MSTRREATQWISIAEAARILGLSRGYVRMLADMRRLRAKRGMVRVRRLDRRAVQRFAQQRARQRARKNFRQPFRPRPSGPEETASPTPAAS